MPKIIKNDRIVEDAWQVLKLADGEAAETVALPQAATLFPLAVWQARKNEIISCHKRIGLLLRPEDKVEEIADDLHYFVVIAVHFPKFVDGRGYSTAALLRQRYHYPGELRAVGDVLHDQLFFMKRVGFDSYALKEGKSAVHAINKGFSVFSEVYQAATDQPEPYFRRRAA